MRRKRAAQNGARNVDFLTEMQKRFPPEKSAGKALAQQFRTRVIASLAASIYEAPHTVGEVDVTILLNANGAGRAKLCASVLKRRATSCGDAPVSSAKLSVQCATAPRLSQANPGSGPPNRSTSFGVKQVRGMGASTKADVGRPPNRSA